MKGETPEQPERPGGRRMDFIRWIQNSHLGVWLREDFWPFPVVLTIHVIGMALVAGTAFAIGLRLQGFGGAIPLAQLKSLRRVCIAGLILIVPTGILLFVSYPAKAVTNPMFYVKLAAIGLGVWLTWFAAPREEADPAFQAGPLPRRVRLYGAGLMAIWIFVIIAGRLLAYTYSFQNILW